MSWLGPKRCPETASRRDTSGRDIRRRLRDHRRRPLELDADRAPRRRVARRRGDGRHRRTHPRGELRAIDDSTIVLLFAMMLLTGSPRRLLIVISLVSGALSAVLVNDTVCVFFTPVVVLLARFLFDGRRQPHTHRLSSERDRRGARKGVVHPRLPRAPALRRDLLRREPGGRRADDLARRPPSQLTS